jgi:hypothetical protein
LPATSRGQNVSAPPDFRLHGRIPGYTAGPVMTRAEVLASLAVADVELTADDREQHRVCTVQKLAVFDGVKSEVGRDLGRPTPIPARTVAVLGLGH